MTTRPAPNSEAIRTAAASESARVGAGPVSVAQLNLGALFIHGAQCAAAMSLLLIVSGCGDGVPRPALLAVRGPAASGHVVGQGKVMPASGFYQLAGDPGDEISAVLVSPGTRVSQGELLMTMKSETLYEKQLAVAHKQLEQAVARKEQALTEAQLRVQAAELKRQQISGQTESLQNQARLLELAAGQVAAAERVVKQLNSIAQDPLTREFVGRIEIEKQQVAVGDAKLDLATQEDTFARASRDVELAAAVADQELEAAVTLRKITAAMDARGAIEAEIEALEEKRQSTSLRAPVDGVVLRVHGKPGEKSGAFPLIEMADLSTLVCEVEINEVDAGRVQVGDTALMTSRAFGDKVLRGKVLSKSAIVGQPMLRSLDPLARVDYRAVTAVVEIDPDASDISAEGWLQLQVEVRLEPGRAAGPASAARVGGGGE